MFSIGSPHIVRGAGGVISDPAEASWEDSAFRVDLLDGSVAVATLSKTRLNERLPPERIGWKDSTEEDRRRRKPTANKFLEKMEVFIASK